MGNLLHEILNTIAFGVIIVGLLFEAVDVSLCKSDSNASRVNKCIAVILGIGGFALLIISMWIT